MSSRQDGTRLRSRDSIYKTGAWKSNSDWKMEAVAEKKNESDKRESSGNAETTSWKLSRDEVVRSRSGKETRMKIGRNVSPSQVLRPFNLNRCAISWWLSRRLSRCARTTCSAGARKGQKPPGLARVRKPSCNARHPQFTGNQRCECFVAVQGETSRMHRLFLVVIEEL